MTFSPVFAGFIIAIVSLNGCADAPPPAANAADTTATQVATAPRLLLEAQALTEPRAVPDSAGLVRFGTPQSETMIFLERVLGDKPDQAGENADCNVSFATWKNGLTVYFANNRFAGWTVRGNEMRTTTGIGIGATRAQLESVYETKIVESTLGMEFNAEGIAGLLDAAQSNAPITHLWAGQTCIAR
jgi:hypothetical protein